MSQTKIQGKFLTDTLTISSNTTFANTAGTYTLPVIDFSSANVQRVATSGKAIAMALVFG